MKKKKLKDNSTLIWIVLIILLVIVMIFSFVFYVSFATQSFSTGGVIVTQRGEIDEDIKGERNIENSIINSST